MKQIAVRLTITILYFGTITIANLLAWGTI